jgi:hypothetical protein
MADPFSTVVQAAFGRLLGGFNARDTADDPRHGRVDTEPLVSRTARAATNHTASVDDAGVSTAATPTLSAASREALRGFVAAATAGDRTAAARHARTVLKKTSLTAGAPHGMASSLSGWLGDGAPNGDVLRVLAEKAHRVLEAETVAGRRAAPGAGTE